MSMDANNNTYNWTSLLVYMMDHKGGPTNSAEDTAAGGTTGGFRKIFLCPSVEGFSDFDPKNNAVTHYLSHPRLIPNLWNGGSGPGADPYRRAHGEPTANMELYKQSKVKRASEIILAFDGSMSLLTGISQTSGYSGNPFYRPRQDTPVADLIDKASLTYSPTAPWLIADWKASPAKKPNTPVPMDCVDASGGAGSNARVNTDQDGNDRNFRFRHGTNDTMNALFVDGHCGDFHTKKSNLGMILPNGGELTLKYIYLDRP
jgi:prepilin-type processing-associated H-X9-DG protein